jgi:hypothetical protein
VGEGYFQRDGVSLADIAVATRFDNSDLPIHLVDLNRKPAEQIVPEHAVYASSIHMLGKSSPKQPGGAGNVFSGKYC